MKKLFCLVFVTLCTITISAQVTWNFKGGVGIATCWGDVSGLESHFVGKLGVGIEKPLSSNWSLMPSLEIAWKGAEYDDGFESEVLDLFYAQIPIVAAYRFNLNDSWNLTLKAGPYFALGIYGNDKYSYGDYNEGVDIFSVGGVNRFDAGLDAGIDFECHRYVFGVEGEIGFLDMIDSIKNLAFYLTVGYKF